MEIPAAMADLVGPACPPIAGRAWAAFLALHATRGGGGMGGVNAITYTELAAYMAITGATLTPLDVTLVRAADDAFLEHAAALLRPEREET